MRLNVYVQKKSQRERACKWTRILQTSIHHKPSRKPIGQSPLAKSPSLHMREVEALKGKEIERRRMLTYLEIIFSVHCNPWTEYVTHCKEVGLLIVHCDTIHSKVLRQKRLSVHIDYVLKGRREGIESEISVCDSTISSSQDAPIWIVNWSPSILAMDLIKAKDIEKSTANYFSE